MKKKTLNGVLVIILLLLATVLSMLLIKVQKEADQEIIEEAGTSVNAEKPAENLRIGDKEYPLKKHISTLLVIGKDDIEGKLGNSPEEGLNYNFDLADFMVVLVFDDDAKTVTPLQLNRDTIAEVPWLTKNGKVGGYISQQITYAHTYGSGGKDSCQNCVRAVSRLFFGAPVEDYISFTMDAIPILNDLVGGVKVTLQENLPSLGENYIRGAEITLKGRDALRFVRYRDTEITESNLQRMMRHQQYLNGFILAARDTLTRNENFVLDALKALDKYLCMNMTVNDISEYINRLNEYQILTALTYEGEYQLGQYAEFYPNMESLAAVTRSAYCK